MKMRYSLILLMLFASLSSAWSKDKLLNNGTPSAEACMMVSSLGNWLEGQVLEGNTLMTYFNTTHPEFLEFANTNGVTLIELEYYWRSNSGNLILPITNEVIDDIYGEFNTETWATIIENADVNGGTYIVRIKINGEACGEEIELPIVTEEIEEEEEDLPIELPEYTCGENFTPENISNLDPLPTAAPGDIFIVGGFPILIETVSGSNGVFTGEGLVPLPFGNKIVKVRFNGIEVNTDHKVFAGEVEAISDDPGNYPNFNMTTPPLNIGGDICLPTPPPPGYNSEGVNEVTGLDPWGFDPETGLNDDTGTEYDTNGFDINGNHVDTGGPFNEQGCNRDGEDENGNPCDPSGGPNPEAEAFAEDIAPTIGNDIGGIVDDLLTALTDSLAELDCGAIREELDELVDVNLQYSRDFIFGEGDRFYNQGMHLEFTEEPKKLATAGLDRNPDAERLEERHIDLYHCDRAEYVVNALKDALAEMENGPSFDELKDEILERIRNWTEYEYGLYADDTEKFNEWLIKQIGEIMKENSGLGDGYVWNDTRPNTERPAAEEQLRSIFDFNGRDQLYHSTASNDQMLFDESFTLEDASFYFRQGDAFINGVDRAFYLEGLAKQQSMVVGGENLLPIEVSKTVGNKTYTIYLDNIVLTPTGAILDGYIIIEDPESGQQFVLKALDIPFGPTGTQGTSRLELDTDIEVRLNNAAMLILKGTEGTYVEWDCEGFSSMGIDAEIEFCRNFITPLDPSTLEPVTDPDERYRLSFSIQEITAWLEFYTTINAPPFAVTNYQDVRWTLTNMVLDFSSTGTPAFEPLEGYDSPFWDGSQMAPAWKGFYMELLSASLPDGFSTNSNPITASAFDILIDGSGFTGGVKVEVPIVPIEEGNLGGWPFSIDKFELRILQNQFAGAGLGGVVNVPVFEENMTYEAVMYPGNLYKFTITPLENVTADLFLATAEIDKESTIEVEHNSDGFLAVATLSGMLHINSSSNSSSGVELDLPSLTFKDLKVSNKNPYFETGTWGIAGGENAPQIGFEFNGFGLTIGLPLPYETADGGVGLGVNLDISLVSNFEINAGGDFGVEGELVEDSNGRQKWKFKRIKLNELYVDASFQGVNRIAGVVQWYDDGEGSEWGKGFRGVLETSFEGLGIEVDAAAQFGKVDGYKYFFIDVMANLGEVGAGTGLLQLKGFGGGISYNMNVIPGPPINFSSGGGPITLPPIGVSISGTKYQPNNGMGLGLRATALLGTVREEIFNGTVSLLVLFNSGNGLEKIQLTGSGQFLAEIDLGIKPDFLPAAASPPTSVNASLSAYIDLEFNFSEPSFHGDLNVFLNAPPFARGAGDGGKMVDAEIHFDPDEWYIYVGRPEEGQRCGVIFEIPGVASVTSQSYLDIGNNVPPMPPLPNKVKEIAYKVNTNESLRQSGAGFVLGASLGFKMSASIAGVASATLEAEAGFDMMLRKYNGLTCLGSTDPVGIDGWYASGQMWAYVYGELKAFGVNVASAGIAAVLQARLPNPFWAQATVGVKIKLLFVTLHKSLKLELGDDCILVSPNSNDDLGMEVITFLEPFEGAKNMATNTRPKAVFALTLGEEIGVADLNGNENLFRVELHSTTLMTSEGVALPHQAVIDENGNALEAIPNEMLPAESEITFTTEVRVYKNGAFLTNEIKSVTFETAESLEIIPETNVAASYPVNGMVNFYKRESGDNRGYIQLISGQPDLLIHYPEDVYQRFRISSNSGVVYGNEYDYDPGSNKISFNMATILLQPGEIYKLEIYRRQKSSGTGNVGVTATATPSSPVLGTAIGGGPSNSSSSSNNNNNNNNTTNPVSNNSAGGGPSPSNNNTATTEQPTEHILYTIYFRVSEYDTFLDKLNDIAATGNGLVKNLGSIEGFGNLEMNGGGKYESLVSFEVDLNNPWVQTDVVDRFEQLSAELCNSNLSYSLDVLESAAGVVSPNGTPISVKELHHSVGLFPMPSGQRVEMLLNAYVQAAHSELESRAFTCVEQTYNALLEACANGFGCFFINNTNEALYETDLAPMRNGTYKARIEYTLPGTSKITTSKVMNFIK